jgi:hypothetical protein
MIHRMANSFPVASGDNGPLSVIVAESQVWLNFSARPSGFVQFVALAHAGT